MDGYLNMGVTVNGCARLIVMGEADLSSHLSHDEVKKIVYKIIEMPVDELLAYVDASVLRGSFDSSEIPQFGKMETLYMIPEVYSIRGASGMDYPQLGFGLKKDPTAKLEANTKYGENHGKVAAQLGILILEKQKLYPSCLTDVISSLGEKEREILYAKLCFRIPIVREFLKRAKDGNINGYEPLCKLSDSTRERRGSSIRTILRQIALLDSEEINRRLSNVQWIKEGDDKKC